MKKGNKNNAPVDITTVGGRIKKLRIDQGISQEELGYAVNTAGKGAVCGYESGRRCPDYGTLNALAIALHTTPEYIMNGTPSIEDPDISEAVGLIKGMRTDKAKKAALEHIKIVAMMEE